jgi:hypothetical protein
VTSPNKEEADSYKANLDEYRWTLRLSSRSAEFLERAISMLATSTGVLMKEIPEGPDPDFVLNRYLRRATLDSSTAQRSSDIASQTHSIVYQSESEFHEDTSPENAFEETSPESGIGNGEWNAESTWFATVAGNANDMFGGDSNPDAYLHMPEIEDPRNRLQF